MRVVPFFTLLQACQRRLARGWLTGFLLMPWHAGAQAPEAAKVCPPVLGLYPHFDTSNVAPLTRYLARAVAMNGLCEELVPAPYSWNQANDKTPCYHGGPAHELASYNDSLTCRGLCNYPFCPVNFAADVALLVQLKASFVQFAASTWDAPERFLPGSAFLRAAAETVARINAAYDCAGLARPFIQASVLENINSGPECGDGQPCKFWMRPGPAGTNSGVNQVPLPVSLITEFADEIISDSARTYYFDGAGRPRSGLHFTFSRLAYLFFGTNYSPDLTRLEGRMWLFYQASSYIDAGYTALHMGQPKVWGRLHQVRGDERARALHRVAILLNRIRRYAHARHPEADTQLILTGEPMTNNDVVGDVVKLIDGHTPDGRDRYLFDFVLATMRPRETSPELDVRAGTNVGTNYRCPTIDPAALITTACAGQNMATIDPCHGFNFMPDGGGTTPLGFSYTRQLPYTVYFDHGETVLRKPSGALAPTGVLSPGNTGTWNWDDSAWFSAALSDACQADWLQFQFANVRSFTSPQLGFLAAPGRLFNSLRVGLDLGPGLPDHPEASVPDYRLAAHPVVAAAVAAAWEPTVPRVALNASTGTGRALGNCPDNHFFRRTFQQLPTWHLWVENPDATSIYSWFVSGPKGVEAIIIGPQLTFLPAIPGSYSIALRQENLGLPAATHGTFVSVVSNLPMATAECSTRAQRRAARRTAIPSEY